MELVQDARSAVLCLQNFVRDIPVDVGMRLEMTREINVKTQDENVENC